MKIDKALRDTNGTVVEVGDQVVYNRSGELELGTVKAIASARSGSRQWHPFTFLITNKKTGEKSKVKQSTTLMVIRHAFSPTVYPIMSIL